MSNYFIIKVSKSLIYFFLMGIMLVFLTLLLSEIGFRLYNYNFENENWDASKSYNKWRAQYGNNFLGFPYNTQGFYDSEHDFESETKKERILLIGDSYLHGVVPLPYNFVQLTQKKLFENKKEVELINLGIPCIGLNDYFQILKEEGLLYSPRKVYLFFFIGNDFELKNSNQVADFQDKKSFFNIIVYKVSSTKLTNFSNSKEEALLDINYKIENDDLKFQNVDYEIHFEDNQESNYSLFELTFINSIKEYLSIHFSSKIENNYTVNNRPTFTEETYDDLINSKKYLFSENSDFFTDNELLFKTIFSNINNLCIENKLDISIIIMPDEIQVNKEIQNKLNKNNDSVEVFNYMLPNIFLIKVLNELKIKHFDMTPFFVDKSVKTRLYKPRDSHWNIEGNKWASEILYNEFYLKSLEK